MKLHLALEQYRTLKQSLGFRFHADAVILKAFGQAMGAITLEQVQPASVRAYLDGPGPVTRFWERKWVTLRGFYQFALARQWVESSPLPAVAPKMPTPFVPYVYSQEELRRLLAAVPEPAVAGLSALTFHTLLLLLYGAGLRISEALRLEDREVSLKDRLLTVRESKFFKSRWVPLGPRLTRVLSDYQQQRPQSSPASGSWFFQDLHGEQVKRSAAERAFRQVRDQAGIKRPAPARYQPRLHDLRHAFTVHCLTHWYRQGANVQRLLPQLATYLGHVDVAATQRYLTLTPELYQQASQRFERYAFPGGAHDQ
jgi:site-specific recombinase XerD